MWEKSSGNVTEEDLHTVLLTAPVTINSPQTDLKFSVILMVNPSSDFVETDKLILHFIWENQGSRIAETNIKKKADTRYQDYCNTLEITRV